jgi:mercuric ion transport protein
MSTAGAVLAAAACPVCFPKFALLGAAFGLGALAPYEGYFAIGVQALFLLSLAGHAWAYRRHRNGWIVALATGATVMLFSGFYVVSSSIMLQFALGVLIAASVWLAIELRRCAACEAVEPLAEIGERNRSNRNVSMEGKS